MSGVSHSWLWGFTHVSFRFVEGLLADSGMAGWREGVGFLIYDDDVGRLSSKVGGSCMALYIEIIWEEFRLSYWG